MATVTLVDSRSRGIRRTVEAEYTSSKGLKISVHDLGAGASPAGDESESFYTVSRKNMPAFCELVGIDPTDPLAGIKGRYSGRSFRSLVRKMLDSELVDFACYY